MMEEQSPSLAARRSLHSGFALLELLVSTVILTVLTSLFLQSFHISNNAYDLFPDQYLRLKSEAMRKGEVKAYEDDTDQNYPAIRFFENGNINQARTLQFQRGNHVSEIIIELGPGTLVFPE
ncbi:MAG: prepilin-type N-terminal cleavage/methylation domain-containing protein [Solobacterium sp.]|nr:prepilin-type N-terminal cleavage/methylation domain-containing protein [Solobacterium sp.]